MSRCLHEKTLWLVFERNGSRADRAHVEHCENCSARLQQLKSDVELLSWVLRGTPPVQAKSSAFYGFPWRWAAVATVSVAILVFVWNGLLTQEGRPLQPATATGVRQEAIVETLADEVSSALFTNDDLLAAEFSIRVPTLAYVQAALDGGWPCERHPASRRVVCDQRPFFLLVEDQRG